MKYSFHDDYAEGAHPEILKYIGDHNMDQQPGYSDDEYCELGALSIQAAFNVPDSDIHFVPNGTMANVIGLVTMLKSFEGVISPNSGHINTHEEGALEATGHKIIRVETTDGKLTPDLIDEGLAGFEDIHTVKPRAVYLTQSTELGTAYTKTELGQVVEYAKGKNLYTYLDGARLAMALANPDFGFDSLQDFGELGLDMFDIGGTKNGGLYGEAMVITNNDLKPDFLNYLKQRGGLMAKGRFMGEQFARFFAEDNLWLELAKHANAQAARLRAGLEDLGVKFDLESGTNQIFPILDNRTVEELLKEYRFYKWEKIGDTETRIRLVCSWATQPDNVDEFVDDVKTLL